jgi:hypothetical protein
MGVVMTEKEIKTITAKYGKLTIDLVTDGEVMEFSCKQYGNTLVLHSIPCEIIDEYDIDYVRYEDGDGIRIAFMRKG